MRIRNAVADDTEALLDMGERFFATTHYRHFSTYDRDTARLLVDMMLQGVLLIAETDDEEPIGMVGLIVTPFLFNQGRKIAHEVMWWVSPGARGIGAGKELLAMIEPACRAAGCDAIVMMTLADSPVHAGVAYQRAGYLPSEHSYTKVL